MYPNVDDVLEAAIARLKGRGYEKIPNGKLKDTVTEFLQDVIRGDDETIERFGPMCLWDVSEVRNFSVCVQCQQQWCSNQFQLGLVLGHRIRGGDG